MRELEKENERERKERDRQIDRDGDETTFIHNHFFYTLHNFLFFLEWIILLYTGSQWSLLTAHNIR